MTPQDSRAKEVEDLFIKNNGIFPVHPDCKLDIRAAKEALPHLTDEEIINTICKEDAIGIKPENIIR